MREPIAISHALAKQFMTLLVKKLHRRGFTSKEIGTFIRTCTPYTGFPDYAVQKLSPVPEVPRIQPERVITEAYVVQMLEHEN